MTDWLPLVARKPQGPYHGGALTPQFVVMHHTGGVFPTDLQTLMGQTGREVSVHFYIGREGDTFQLQPCNVVAWHAGKSKWKHGGVEFDGMNHFALGIEMENLDGNKHHYTAQQWIALQRLVPMICNAIPVLKDPARWVGHEDVSPGRKIDPGKLFPMNELREFIKKEIKR